MRLLCAILVGLCTPAFAQDAPQLPLWELGIGTVGRASAEYPGASEYTGSGTVYPYLTYRGRLIEFGGDATFRLIPIRTERLEFGVSIDGSSAVDSGDNALRGALPDLDALVEFGPDIGYRLSEGPAVFGTGTGRLEASLQARGVFSIDSDDFDVDRVGALVRPALRYRQNGSLKPGSRITATIGPVFATEGVHDFFYAVPSGGTLAPYDARGGYLGTEVTLSARYPLTDRLRLVGGVGVTLLHGAANEASPLFEDKVNGSAFFGLTYSFYQSKRRTARDR